MKIRELRIFQFGWRFETLPALAWKSIGYSSRFTPTVFQQFSNTEIETDVIRNDQLSTKLTCKNWKMDHHTCCTSVSQLDTARNLQYKFIAYSRVPLVVMETKYLIARIATFTISSCEPRRALTNVLGVVITWQTRGSVETGQRGTDTSVLAQLSKQFAVVAYTLETIKKKDHLFLTLTFSLIRLCARNRLTSADHSARPTVV